MLADVDESRLKSHLLSQPCRDSVSHIINVGSTAVQVQMELLQAFHIWSQRYLNLVLRSSPGELVWFWILFTNPGDSQNFAVRPIFDDLLEQDHLQMKATVHCFILFHLLGVWVTVYFLKADRSVILRAFRVYRTDI